MLLGSLPLRVLLLAVSTNSLTQNECDGGEIARNSSCSIWQYLNNTVCTCGPKPFRNSLICEESKNLTVFNSNCITRENSSSFTYFGSCLYYISSVGSQRLLKKEVIPNSDEELNEFLCGKHFNRTGILCGKCKDGHYPLAHSFDMNCVKCPNGKSNWWKYLLATILPLTLFYFFIVLFQINLIFSVLEGFVWFSHVVALPGMVRVVLVDLPDGKSFSNFIRIGYSVFSLWNLDILRPFKLGICLGTNTLQTLALEYIVGVYPLFLIMLSYILVKIHDSNFKPLVIIWKPFKVFLSLFHHNRSIKTSIIDAFATFYYLSCVKFLSISLDLLSAVKVYELNCTGHLTHSWRLYYAADVAYFGEEHLPYAILALATLTLFVLCPTILLIVYPFRWFQKFLNMFPIRWFVLHTFVDVFQGCYKDGSEPGTRDSRWIASSHFIVRLLLVMMGSLLQNIMFFLLLAMILSLEVVLFQAVQPYKAGLAHLTDVKCVFLLLLALWSTAIFTTAIQYRISHYMTSLLLLFMVAATITSLLIVVAIVIRWIFLRRKFGRVFISRLYAWKHRYIALEEPAN